MNYKSKIRIIMFNKINNITMLLIKLIKFKKIKKDTIGGGLIFISSFLALILANSSFKYNYFAIQNLKINFLFEFIGIHITLKHMISDGLLAIFFFLAGLELKREVFKEKLNKNISKILVPISAALGGVIFPAFIFIILNLNNKYHTLHAWAIPTATDIAFALSILAIINTHLPSKLRTFLLTLAIFDDLIAVIIIAIFYSKNLNIEYILYSIVPFMISMYFIRKKKIHWLIIVFQFLLFWYLIYMSGIHATISGILFGFLIPSNKSYLCKKQFKHHNLDYYIEKKLEPISSIFAVPLFAFFSSGINFDYLSEANNNISYIFILSIIISLFLGKPIGVIVFSFLSLKVLGLKIKAYMHWKDMYGIACLSGVGFTISLLISELSFNQENSVFIDQAKLAILLGSLISAILSLFLLKNRNKFYKNLKVVTTYDF